MTQTRRDTLFPQVGGVGLTTPHRDEIMTKEAWKSDLIMATWNVRTMLIPGKMQEINKEMMKYKIHIIALYEILRQGQSSIDKPDYTLLYSGSDNRPAGNWIYNKQNYEKEPIRLRTTEYVKSD